MNKLSRIFIGTSLAAAIIASPVFAQTDIYEDGNQFETSAPSYGTTYETPYDEADEGTAYGQDGVRQKYSRAELEQMLAPIALYPDSLLSQVLMASTYPTELVEAAYWLKQNSSLKGENAISAAQDKEWDISVKSLLAFPQVLNTMESNMDWTYRLGNAFLEQENEVMDAIQNLRNKARDSGTLKSDEHMRVLGEGSEPITIETRNPSTVYVPYYNPQIVYGRWSYPDYEPMYWDPWTSYGYSGITYSGWSWSPLSTMITAGILYSGFDWGFRRIRYRDNVRYWHGHRYYDNHRPIASQFWAHDARHRREAPYRTNIARKRFANIANRFNKNAGYRPSMREIRSFPRNRRNFQGYPNANMRNGNNGSPNNRNNVFPNNRFSNNRLQNRFPNTIQNRNNDRQNIRRNDFNQFNTNLNRRMDPMQPHRRQNAFPQNVNERMNQRFPFNRNEQRTNERTPEIRRSGGVNVNRNFRTGTDVNYGSRGSGWNRNVIQQRMQRNNNANQNMNRNINGRQNRLQNWQNRFQNRTQNIQNRMPQTRTPARPITVQRPAASSRPARSGFSKGRFEEMMNRGGGRFRGR